MVLVVISFFLTWRFCHEYLFLLVIIFELFVAHLNEHVVINFVWPATFKLSSDAAVKCNNILLWLWRSHFWSLRHNVHACTSWLFALDALVDSFQIGVIDVLFLDCPFFICQMIILLLLLRLLNIQIKRNLLP